MPNIYDIIRAAVLIGAFIFNARLDRKSWMLTDSMLVGSYGLGYSLFPGSLLESGGSMESYLVRLFGAIILGQVLIWYLTRRTVDDAVVGTILWSRLMGILVLLLVVFQGFWQSRESPSNKNVWFDLLGFLLLLGNTICYLVRGRYAVGGREQKGPVSIVLRIYFLILFFSGLCCMAFPKVMMPFKPLEKLDVVIMRSIGAVLFGNSIEAWYAPSWRSDENKNAFFISQILTSFLFCVTLAIAFFIEGTFNFREALILHTGVVPGMVILVGMYFIWKEGRDGNAMHSSYFTRSKSS
ncbi:hypothetical protein CHS0354_005517 [Potamilus streckersoni]|uniref:Uncharacterized protein n=1 Tax=Potamilus streckersoni TaxID=2493646 RepID=A0AAE0VM95_9BIVA|nr:hypothetical protein CHS0354_005517 [Potamilus streckersoni]